MTCLTQQQQKQHENEESQEQSANIRCMGPYKVSPSLWLSPVVPSDTSEVYRILNIDKSIHNGLYSAKMRFPFSEEEACRFTAQHVQKRTESGTCQAWAIRTRVGGKMIGLFALDSFDHGDMGPCYRGKEPVTNAAVDNAGEKQDETLRCGGFGYWVSPEHQGKGIMTEVLSFALTKMVRPVFGYDRVHGEAWTDNVGSWRVMERVGMRPAVGVPVFVPKFNTTKDIAHYVYDTE
ncbi:hypothetical protein BGX33_000537 [Mortierella sp. NVP41]|nr:hypothetical protein BGX33_000537 [Mortierella sp. NVP41]